MIERRALVLAGGGILAGLGATLALGRFLVAVLYGVAPTDAVTLASVTALLFLVAWIAAVLPASRAARIDPILAIREA